MTLANAGTAGAIESDAPGHQLGAARPFENLADKVGPQRTRTTPSAQPGGASGQKQNVGDSERAVSVAAGGLLTALGLTRGTVPGLLLAGIGGALLHRGFTGYCHLNAALGVDTAHPPQVDTQRELSERGIEVTQAMLIDRPAEDLYKFWRMFENLPGFMQHLQSVKEVDEKRSHWVTKAPTIAGGSVEWDAEITRDEPNVAIAWRSLPGSDVDTMGEIRFEKAPGDRGTEVHVSMKYLPQAGKLGHWIATLFGESPSRQMRDDLRRFKAIMEVGETPSINGQPRGTCLGRGKRATNEV